jgi:small multidrug resistance pump
MSISFDWSFWSLLIAAAALELAGDLSLKWWAASDNWLGFGAGLGAYAVSVAIFAVLLRRAELAIIFTLWVGIAIVLVALAGWWLFGETLTVRHLAGITLVVAGIVLLGRG